MSQHSSDGAVWRALRAVVLERDNWTCQWCQKAGLTGRDATVDHYPVPASKGGPDELWNLVACCRSCNASRGDRELVRTTGSRLAWFGGIAP